MADKPSWMDGGGSGATSSARDVESSSRETITDKTDPPYFRTVKTAFFITNIGMMIFLAATGALGIGSANGINDTGLIFVGLYLIIFAGLVFFYELAQVLRWERLDMFMKRNFGFLYGVNGKGLFILMTGILCFGLSKPRTLSITCGIIVSAWGPAQILVYMKAERTRYAALHSNVDDHGTANALPKVHNDKSSLLSAPWQ